MQRWIGYPTKTYIYIYNQYIYIYIYIYIGYIIVRDESLKKKKKKRFVYLFRAPLFLGMWYGVATYFSLHKRKKKY